MPNLVRRMRWKGHISLRCLWQCGSVFHKASAQQGSTRGKARLVRNPAVFLAAAPTIAKPPVHRAAGEHEGARPASYEIGLSFCLKGKKIAPCSNIGTRGYPAVFGSITRTSFCFHFLPCAEVLRCTRTPTAVKGNALSRFRTTACRLRSYRTQSASGRFSTSDSPPSIPLNLYSKGAAPREGLLLSSGSGYSIAACFLFVNDLINKNCIKCSAKTPNFHCLVPTPLRAGRWQILRAARKRKTAVRIRRRTAAAALVQRSLGAAL